MATEYHVYGSPSAGAPIDYSTVLATVSGLTWSTPALTAGTWQFAVRAFDTVSLLEEQNTDCTVTITISAALADITAVPAPPTGLAATATAGGSAHVTWCYSNTPGAAKPTGFHVYGGTPTVSYGTPLATVPATLASLPYAAAPAPLERYKVDLTGLTDGATYQIAVRAYNATGEEPNTVTVSLTADATPPSAVQYLSAS